MGRVAGHYGVRGWLKVAPKVGVLEGLVKAGEWWIGGEARRVVQARRHSATVVAKLEGFETPEQARALKGQEVSVAREALPPPGEGHYYLVDLVGMQVVNGSGVAFGVVRQWLTNGPQDVMEVEGERLRLLPWVPTVVKQVDLEAGRIEVEWEADW
ncbi:MAG: ribosome maturation factor RimM [Burkholderiales bacterium]